ncbi:F-box/WD repeat-containing protein 5-like protein [Dinothrombium tinctorium]|uniref:F-box/WD repeat-containing protein 5-like protein n=1 Tax=Dinothrombium tinctorium TaxID=1965070 RepID=A0A3S3QNT6_9ACAR|nr:F-box/WD repeat-containing protein 5-like protein [Dinothrombium tinctorium]RWS11791.1 F-box/WD repeat-containing protein 5-like protein [Dinothrombium tinctorium]
MDWNTLCDSILLHIFGYLDFKSVAQCGCVCKHWARVANDEFLWKKMFFSDFNIDSAIEKPEHAITYKSEYKRLYYKSPVIECDTLHEHTNQVLHVTFSHCGRLFSTCSKDGNVKVWRADCFPFKVKYSKDMKAFHWRYTQFSQFNETDTLLLVSGVHFGVHTASGEIAVFSLNDFQLQCRVLNKPYDIFGAWYTNEYLLSGRLHFLGHLVSCSDLWLNKAYQESESERKPIVKRLFKFYNKNASSIRTILVANCQIDDDALETEENNQKDDKHSSNDASRRAKGNPVSKQLPNSPSSEKRRSRTLHTSSSGSDSFDYYEAQSSFVCSTQSPIRYSVDYRKNNFSNDSDSSTPSSEGNSFSDPPLPWEENWFSLSDDEDNGKKDKLPSKDPQPSSSSSSDDELKSEGRILDEREKLLIFTSGSLTYTPHQIGIKRIKPFRFKEFVTETLTLSQRLEEKRREEESGILQMSPNWQDENVIRNYFDSVDHVIDIKGHIIGMGLSIDHRYLYVNSRSWPEGYVIENPLSPPPIAQQIDINVIDLKTLKKVGKMFKSHKAYTPNDECFFIFLDVNQQFIASGAEDKHCYIWDCHYGNCLAKLPHNDVVNCVAFSHKDTQVMLSASDDNTIKVWMSRKRMRKLKQKNKELK